MTRLSPKDRTLAERTTAHWSLLERDDECGFYRLKNAVSGRTLLVSFGPDGAQVLGESGAAHRVTDTDCTCPDHEFRRAGREDSCRHRTALLALRAILAGYRRPLARYRRTATGYVATERVTARHRAALAG